MSTAPAIEMSGVAVSHPRAPALTLIEPVDWRVEPGECWVVAGLQGSGKTALLETAAGLTPACRGEVRLFGEPVPTTAGGALSALRQRIGLLFDGTGRLFPALTVLENIVLPLRYHRDLTAAEATQEVAPLLAALDLERFAGQLPGRIGRAWSRRAALARALASRPKLILLDNPLEGLDPTHLRWWRGFLETLRRGHPWLGGEPATLLIAGDELRPLLGLGGRFALAHEHGWRILGDRAAVTASQDPFLRELLDEPG